MTLPLTLVQGAYVVAGLLFIMALAGLSRHESARAGNRFGIVGMAVALLVTVAAATAGVDAAPAGAGGADRQGSGWSSPWPSVRRSGWTGPARSR
jgi:NAD(P) transhydrogenase subunit beta